MADESRSRADSISIESATEDALGAPFVVEVPVRREPATVVLGSIDAVLAARSPGIEVRVHVPVHHPDRQRIMVACGGDPRVRVVDHGPSPEPVDGAVLFRMPPRARPADQTLVALARLVAERGGPVEATVPGLLGPFERFAWSALLPHRHVVRAVGAGGRARSRRVPGAAVGLAGPSGRRPPPPIGDLSHERAEHIRNRARSNTNEARAARGSRRLALERLRVRQELARVGNAERRLGAAGVGPWLEWRLRQGVRLAAGARRFLADRPARLRRRWRQVRRVLLRR